jgi:hypothetical protein
MRSHLPVIVLLALLCGTINLFAQSSSEDPRWSRPSIDLTNSVVQNTKWQPAVQVHRQYNFRDVVADVSPNFRPHPTTNTTQSEMSIDVHPTDADNVFASANASNWPVTTIYGTGVYWSLDGGTSWSGADNPPFGGNGGDPASVIGPNGYYYEGYLVGGSYALGIAVSTNSGANWSTHTVYASGNQDKEHVMVDKTASSPYVNRVYYPWSNLNASQVGLVYSTDFGSTWSAYKNVSAGVVTSGFGQGPNVQTAANGDVYVCYAVYDANWTDGEDAIGFSKSTDGGATWTGTRAYDHLNFGIRGTLSSKGGMRVNSFPSMAVDRSGGPNDGNIYICWPQRSVAPAGNDPDVIMVKSTDGGTTWSAPFRVNDDALNNGKDQIFPWCTVDQSTGQLMVVFYDSRNVSNNMAEVFMATSYDGGDTFNNFVVSDQSFVFGPIAGFAGGYGGDYIGIAAVNDVAYPYWMDSRTGNSQGWMAKVTFGPPCPVEAATDPTPANGAMDVSNELAQLSWTNGAGAVTNELYWGTDPGNLELVQSGSLASSWDITGGPLQYSTNYYWRVNEIGDTCNQNGPIWSFTTEQDPSLVTLFFDDFESGIDLWTITNDGGSCVWEIFTPPYPNTYSLPCGGQCNGVFAADADECGSGTTLLSTAKVTETIDATQFQTVTIEWDNDWNAIDNGDFAYVDVSTDGGTTWQNVVTFNGTDVSNSHEYYDISSMVALSTFELRFKSEQPGWDWWWAVDNVKVMAWNMIPVELSSFTASASEGNVALNWSTATETNNRGFDVERKSENGQYQKAGYVPGFGTTTSAKNYSYTDENVAAGNYTYRLRQIDLDGTSKYSNEVEVEVTVPAKFALEQNYPNPFNPTTMIKYSIPQDQQVKLNVYNLLGENVMTLVNSFEKAGQHEVNFNASSLASGVYFYKLEAGTRTSIKKMVLMK